jgi:hypothetical protein
MLSSKIELLMYRTFAFQSGESARQQRLTPVLPCVLLWSIRAVDHLSKSDSRNDPTIENPPEGPKAFGACEGWRRNYSEAARQFFLPGLLLRTV